MAASTTQRPVDYKPQIKKTEKGLYTFANAYEGQYEFFTGRPIQRAQASCTPEFQDDFYAKIFGITEGSEEKSQSESEKKPQHTQGTFSPLAMAAGLTAGVMVGGLMWAIGSLFEGVHSRSEQQQDTTLGSDV